MENKNIAEGIERFIKYIRRMSLLADDQLRFVIGSAINQNPDAYLSLGVNVEGHIQYIRKMSMLSDDNLRALLKKSVEDPVMQEIFEDAAKKKTLLDMQKMAKDIRSNAKSIARRVDEF